MESDILDHYVHLKIALKEAGFKVDETGFAGKKTVITVIRAECFEETQGEQSEIPLQPDVMGGKL